MTDIPAYPQTIAELTAQIIQAKGEIDTFLNTLTDAQKEERGIITRYAIKDHLAHLAVWEQGIITLLNGQSRWATMKLDADYVDAPSTHFDDLNAIIFIYHKSLSYSEAYQLFETNHTTMLAKLYTMKDADLHVPENRYREKGGDEPEGLPNGVRIMWNTYEHYEEHLPWMREQFERPHVSVNHIAIVVPEIEANLSFWRDALGLQLGEQKEVPQEQVKITFLEAGGSHIELVQPTTDDSGIAQYLAKKGAGMHHICFDVPNIEQAMARLRECGATLLSDICKTRDGRKYIFIHPKSTGGVLVELYERL